MTNKEIVIREDKAVALYELETRFAMATRQRELLEKYIKERLKPDKHFYTIADGQKPSLTKGGAELICLPHALKAHYYLLSGPENPPADDTPYQITIKCELEASGKFSGEGIGSASSHITKKDGDRIVRQKDPGLRHNATIKMASKSAYIAATLNSTAASEFFTQDMEDDQSGEQEEKQKYFCAKHKKKWFKTEKMKNYAHPIEGTKDWCYMPIEKPAEKPLATPSPATESTATNAANSLPAELKQATNANPEPKAEPVKLKAEEELTDAEMSLFVPITATHQKQIKVLVEKLVLKPGWSLENIKTEFQARYHGGIADLSENQAADALSWLNEKLK